MVVVVYPFFDSCETNRPSSFTTTSSIVIAEKERRRGEPPCLHTPSQASLACLTPNQTHTYTALSLPDPHPTSYVGRQKNVGPVGECRYVLRSMYCCLQSTPNFNFWRGSGSGYLRGACRSLQSVERPRIDPTQRTPVLTKVGHSSNTSTNQVLLPASNLQRAPPPVLSGDEPTTSSAFSLRPVGSCDLPPRPYLRDSTTLVPMTPPVGAVDPGPLAPQRFKGRREKQAGPARKPQGRAELISMPGCVV